MLIFLLPRALFDTKIIQKGLYLLNRLFTKLPRSRIFCNFSIDMWFIYAFIRNNFIFIHFLTSIVYSNVLSALFKCCFKIFTFFVVAIKILFFFDKFFNLKKLKDNDECEQGNPLGHINTTLTDDNLKTFEDWRKFDDAQDNFCDPEG